MIKYNIGMGDKYMKNKIKVIIRIIIILLVVVLIFLITNYLIHKNDCCSCCPEGSNTCIEMCCKCKGAIFNGRQEYINATAKNKKDFFYITKSFINIAGSSDETDVSSGDLKRKEDLILIMKDIENDSSERSQYYVSYLYGKNNKNKRLDSFDEFGDKLFK